MTSPACHPAASTPRPLAPGPVDVIAILTGMQEQLDNLLDVVTAQQKRLEDLEAAQRTRAR